MSSFPVLIILGPCLLLILGAIAQLVIHRYLSRVQHARIWAASFTLGAAQWGIVGVSAMLGHGPFRISPISDLMGLSSAFLLAWGFSRRAGRRGATLPIAMILGWVLLIATSFLPPIPLRMAVYPLVTGLMFAIAAKRVTPVTGRCWPIEQVTAALLWLMVALSVAVSALAVAEQCRLVAGQLTYALLLTAAVQPACAALPLFTLLLIAQDFWMDLRRMIHTDPLTGVLNRLGFTHAVQAIMGRRRGERPFSLCIADIDGFKQINDVHGHAAGDAALVRFATHIAHSLDHHECVARIGGEEFALLMPGSDSRNAVERIERLRKSLPGLVVDDHPDISLRASFGVTECASGEGIETVIERADRALYRSKHGGRDRVTLVEPPTHG